MMSEWAAIQETRFLRHDGLRETPPISATPAIDGTRPVSHDQR